MRDTRIAMDAWRSGVALRDSSAPVRASSIHEHGRYFVLGLGEC